MVNIDDYNIVKDCIYKDEHYSVRDNGAVMRHSREGKRTRKNDNEWTFGKQNEKNGYLEIAGERIHRIVASAFHGKPEIETLVVDHIDTNRQNNRPENLRWVTRLENVLNNPITRARIENLCGSIETFLANPSVLRGHEHIDPNFYWMRTVTPEEARISLERMTKWAKEKPASKGGTMGEWIFQEKKTLPDYPKTEKLEEKPVRHVIQSLTQNAVQVNWKTPSEFPCCPSEISEQPIEDYKKKLLHKAVFCKNALYQSVVTDSALADEGKAIVVICEGDFKWSLSKITFENNTFVHESLGTFFEEVGARKYFTLAQGLEWTGGDVFDDYC